MKGALYEDQKYKE